MANHHDSHGLGGDFLALIDLSEAYLHMPIRPSHRKYLCFSYGSKHYQYRALPFGLSAALRVFTKLLVALVVNLRLQGIRIFPYLDDILIAASSFSQASQDHVLPETPRLRNQFDQELPGSVPETRSSRPSRRHHVAPTVPLSGTQDKTPRDTPTSQGTLICEPHVSGLPLDLMVSCQDVILWSHFHLRPLQSFLRPYASAIER